jgi:hypothetical protein
MATAPNNEQRLRAAGIITCDDLPQEYVALVEGLTSHEVEIMLAMKRRLDEAARVSGRPATDCLIPP